MGPEREISSRSVDDLSEQLRESSRSTSDLGAGVQILTHAVQSLKSSVDDSVRGPGERYVRVAHLEEMFAERGGFVSTVSQEIESATRALGQRLASLPAEVYPCAQVKQMYWKNKWKP